MGDGSSGYWFVIPARAGSKGFPNKNRVLVPHLIDNFPSEINDRVILTTDDEYLINKYDHFLDGYFMQVRVRPSHLSKDDVSVKAVVEDVIDYYDIPDDDLVFVLYPTYPERTFEEVFEAFFLLDDNNGKEAKSLLCKKKIDDPKLHLYFWEKDGGKGEYISEKLYYRRQDVPKYFEASHYIVAFVASELKNLNDQFFNEDTVFFEVGDKIDVDTEDDFAEYINHAKEKEVCSL